jgi:hypothetical protein
VCWLLAVAAWAYVLWGFVSTPSLVVLSLLGATLAVGGLYLASAAVRYVADSPWYLGAFLFGLALLAGAAATLTAGAPAELLVRRPSGWGILEGRAAGLGDAIADGDVALASRIARRGLGEAGPLGSDGRPLIHGVQDSAMLAALLGAGLDPDARDTDGVTLLMSTRDAGMARALLVAGADPNAATGLGTSVLAASRDKDPEIQRLLREAGARDDGPGRVPPLTDWLAGEEIATGSGEGSGEGSRVSLAPRPLRRGDVAALDVRLVNDSDEDRLLEVRAMLNDAAYFVGASHGGAIENPAQPQLVQTVRWPRLSLPAGREGRLELRVVARSDEDAGDLSVDVRIRSLPGIEEEVLTAYESPATGDLRPEEPTDGALVGFGAALGAGLAAAWRRRPATQKTRLPRALAAAAAALCAGLAAVLLWSALRPYRSFEETTCTVLDRRIALRSTRTSSTGSRGAGPSTTVYGVPVAAVRVGTAADPVVATGFAAGAFTRSVPELRGFPLGAQVPCWTAPGNPREFTLVRRLPATGWLGTGMLALLAFAFLLIARRLP